MALSPHVTSRLLNLGISISEVDERFVRGSGPGGQKINKTSSTVWLRHRPTGIEVRCQEQRFQSDNRESAWNDLCDRLEARARASKAEAVQKREKQRRRTRQKSRGQKARMIESKKHRAAIKGRRARPALE